MLIWYYCPFLRWYFSGIYTYTGKEVDTNPLIHEIVRFTPFNYLNNFLMNKMLHIYTYIFSYFGFRGQVIVSIMSYICISISRNISRHILHMIFSYSLCHIVNLYLFNIYDHFIAMKLNLYRYTGCSLNIVFFSRILESLHSAAIGCTKRYQPIGLTVHSHCVEGLLQRCKRGRGCSGF